MSKANSPAPRGRPWLRRLGWLAFAALSLIFTLLVGWRVFEHSMRAKVRARIAAVPPRVMGEKEKEKEKEGRIPMGELEFVGGAFSTDEARREEFRQRMAELERFWTAVGFGSRDALDFVQVLKRLGVEVPTGMTNAQAAAEFLRQAAGVKETLALIRRDLERGPWRWEKDVALHPEKWPAHNEVLEVFWVGLPLQAALTEAEWLGGDKTAGAEAMSLLSAAQKQLSTGDPALRLFSRRTDRQFSGEALREGSCPLPME